MINANNLILKNLRCLSFNKEHIKTFKQLAKEMGVTMPRFYHDAILKGADVFLQEKKNVK